MAIQYTPDLPRSATDLVHFRKRIGVTEADLIFKMSVMLHGKEANETTVLIDLRTEEKTGKNITYPTDSKLSIKIINRLNKLTKQHGIKQRRTFVKEVKNRRLRIRHFRQKDIETIANHCPYYNPRTTKKTTPTQPV